MNPKLVNRGRYESVLSVPIDLLKKDFIYDRANVNKDHLFIESSKISLKRRKTVIFKNLNNFDKR